MNRNRLCEVSLCVMGLAIVVTGTTAQPCEPYWSDQFASADLEGWVSGITVFDDGSGDGPALYIGGFFTTGGDVTLNGVARLDGNRWAPLGGGVEGAAAAFAGFDDGSGDGPALYVGGDFSTAGGVRVNNIAKWDGTTWSALGSGLDGGTSTVRALAVFDDGSGAGPALYAAGFFTTAGGVSTNNIAKWDGTSWSPLGAGIDSLVNALAVFDDGSGGGPALYAAGFFTTAGGVAANRIAKWDGTSWSPLGEGLDATVKALTVFDDGSTDGPALYAGGSFATAGGVRVSNIAKWDGTTWSPVGGGTDGSVSALTVLDDSSGNGPALYAGGSFETAGGVTVNRIARWDGSSWWALGNGMDGSVWALADIDHDPGNPGAPGTLYAGGFFHRAGGVDAHRFAKWDGSAWSGVAGGINGIVSAFTSSDDGAGGGSALYAGGVFNTAGGVAAHSIAKWDGHVWSAVGTMIEDEIGWVDELTVFDDGSGGGSALYAGGVFTTIGGVEVNAIAKWDGKSWSALGSGMGGSVLALTVFDDGSGSGPALYAAGFFTTAGGVSASNIAKWDGSSWSPLGTGLSGPSSPIWIWALTVFDDGSGDGPALYAGGNFTTAGGVEATGIARWDGSSWAAVGSGFDVADNRSVYALAVYDDGNGPALYAGGRLDFAGDVEVNGIAKWDGSLWSDLGGGVAGVVRGLAVLNDGSGDGPALYAAGSFATAGEVSANSIARWDGALWSPLGAGIGYEVLAIAAHNDGSSGATSLFAGGKFITAGGMSSQYIAEWVGCASAAVGDLDGDGSVGMTDLLILLSAWGPCPDPPDPCPADLNGDGTVGILDLLTLLSNWG